MLYKIPRKQILWLVITVFMLLYLPYDIPYGQGYKT